MQPVRLGEREIGPGQPPLFVAELGICHRGRLDVALDNARAAAEAGAGCIKTELFHESEVRDPSATKTFSTRSGRHAVPLLEHMRRYQFTLEQHHKVKLLADELGLPFMATAHTRERVDFLVAIGACAVKIASPDIVHYPLIRYAAASGLVLFLDTGGAWQHEVEMAVKAARDAGCRQLVVNHNPDGHPAPPAGHNLRAIARYQELFGCPVGLSDHCDGYDMAFAAVVAGAHAVEKPVSEDRFIEECEHIWAVSRADLPGFVASLGRAWEALGQPARPMGPGLRPASPHRVALVARRDLAPGEPITWDNVTFGKPRLGIGVELWDELEGRPLGRAVRAGAFIRFEDL